MNKRNILGGIVIAIVIFNVILLLSWAMNRQTAPSGAHTPPLTLAKPFDQTVSDGNISFGYSSQEFGLATTPEQILVKSYIPACLDGFEYCLYYNDDKYAGTNFESAGLGITKRADLKDEKACLNASPLGYSNALTPSDVHQYDSYSTSLFTNLGDAAMGHYSTASLYHLFLKSGSSCYEFYAQIGQSRYENYPEGQIKKFSDSDLALMQGKLKRLLGGVTISGGEKVIFP